MHDGCPFCEARAAGGALAAPDGSAIDAPSARPNELYVTTARVLAAYDRAVLLTPSQRRVMLRRWIEADLAALDPLNRRDPSKETA